MIKRLNIYPLLNNASPIVVLIALSFLLFRAEFSGHTWIGNPDRLNSDLKVMQHYLSGSETGTIDAWDQNEMMGYDSFALPYTFPNPLSQLMHFFGKAALFSLMGYVVIVLLAIAGLASYACICSIVEPGLAALTAAICYQFSALTILKVSQNSMSFAVFIIYPLAVLAVRRITRATAANQFLLLGLLLGFMLGFMFLQKAAYVLIVIGAYSVWRSYTQRSFWSVGIFTASLLVALCFAAPRLAGIGTAMGEYTRVIQGLNFSKFADLYRFQNIHPYEIWRWFDDTIFGRYPSDAAIASNNINLSEGFLIGTSAIVPFLIIFELLRSFILYWRQPKQFSDALFFGVALIFCILVVTWETATKGIYFLFLKMDFTHARILVAALLPLTIVLALSLKQLQPSKKDINETRLNHLLLWGAGLAAALVLNFGIEWMARSSSGWVSQVSQPWLSVNDLAHIRITGHEFLLLNTEALLRIKASIVVLIGLTSLLFFKRIPSSLKKIASFALCGFISIQCLLGANERVNGQQVFNFIHPFYMGNMYYARSAEFAQPTQQQLTILHQRLNTDAYRVALICDPKLAGGFCAGHVPEFWNLRAIDGYYGLGVPTRLRVLPWPTDAGLRTISFSRIEDMPWALLGFLNVNSVLVVSDGVYRNIVRRGDSIVGVPNPEDFTLIPSPARVTPRAFFSSNVESVQTMNLAVNKIFASENIVDPLFTSFAENFPQSRQHFVSSGPVVVEGQGDRLLLHFKAAPTDRFLVLNELYFPGWEAEARGRPLKIYATNVVMRGVVVPAGVETVSFYYTALSVSTVSKIVRLLSVILLICGFLYLRYFCSKNKTNGDNHADG